MAEAVSLGTMLVAFLASVGAAILLYRFSNKKLMAKIFDLRKKNDDLVQIVERLYQARLNDNRELKTRLEAVEGKVEVLAMPKGRHRKLEMEKIFARGGHKHK